VANGTLATLIVTRDHQLALLTQVTTPSNNQMQRVGMKEVPLSCVRRAAADLDRYAARKVCRSRGSNGCSLSHSGTTISLFQ
jgi:hypothetical protein